MGSDMVAVANGAPIQFERFVQDHEECIRRLVAAADGSIWVLTPHGLHDQPEGVLETWGVFDRNGPFRQQVAVSLGHAMRAGFTFFSGGDLLVAVKGGGDQRGNEGEAEVEPLEVICYRMRSA